MLQVPSKFLARLREPVDWPELRYAYDNHLVDEQAVIDHACRLFSKSGYGDSDVLAIAFSRTIDDLKPLLDRVAGPPGNTNGHVVKWALILAAFISETDVGDKLEAVEDVYSSLDYPEELAQFIRYMPINGPDLGSQNANETRMLESLTRLAAEIVTPE